VIAVGCSLTVAKVVLRAACGFLASSSPQELPLPFFFYLFAFDLFFFVLLVQK
jgi:hypothetical protein